MPEQQITIPGQVGNLEAVVSTPVDWVSGAPIAICCHPHPVHGGTMHNKVVHILAKTFAELGAKVLRFNFRGAGKSQGTFDHGEGEQQDLLAVVDYCSQDAPGSPLWLSGFSFGAYVVLMAHAQLQPERLLVVAPPVEMYPAITTIQVVTQDWILIQGGVDEIVAADSVRQWADGQAIAPQLIWLDDAGHFFHGKLTSLQDHILELWSR